MQGSVFCGEILTYTSYEGGSVNIRCPYNAKYKDNTKYLYRGKYYTRLLSGNKDIPIESGVPPKDQRFSLNDNKRDNFFTITITDLQEADEGQYWCAVKRLAMDDYSEVLLLCDVCTVCDFNVISCFYAQFSYLSSDLVSHVSGVKGEQLSIKCLYDYGVINNDKFFCKGEDSTFCETSGVKVSRGKNTNGRFFLNDDTSARVFTVIITDLTEEDSGIYWCGNVPKGSQPAHEKWISVINLTTSEASITSERTSHTPTTDSIYSTKPASTDSSSRPTISSSSPSSSLSSLSSKPQSSLMWIVILLFIAMLMLCGFLMFIYFRRSKTNKGLQLSGVTSGSDENLNNVQLRQTRVSVCDHKEIQLTNDHSDFSLASPVSGEDDASVTVAQYIFCDDLNYSTIRFTDHSDKTFPDGQISSDYATVLLYKIVGIHKEAHRSTIFRFKSQK
nr:polymeric immunoglobulin receptor-like [Misgurnus anguillicaudatus]